MASVNKVTLIGYLGQQPELKDANGTPVCNVTLATSESWKDRSGEKQERTSWHRLTFWGRTAEVVAEYCTKGQHIYVEGSLQYSEYEKDGVTIPTTNIRVWQLTMLGKASDRGQASEGSRGRTSEESEGTGGRETRQSDASDYKDEEDDLPF